MGCVQSVSGANCQQAPRSNQEYSTPHSPLPTPYVVLGLGSNLGDSRLIILDAVEALRDVLEELRAASLYETAPLYVTRQASFINTAVAGFYPEQLDQGASTGGEPQPLRASAEGSARKLLHRINEIEARFGRDRSRERRWGERPLDIDILLFGSLVLDEDGLQIPHQRLKERRFALEPLLELLPEAVEPGTGVSYREICNSLPAQGVRMIIKNFSRGHGGTEDT